MGLGLSIELEGTRKVREAYDGALEGSVDLSPALRQTARLLRERQRQVFLTAGASQGTPWKPLSAATQEMKAKAVGYYRRGSGRGILRASGGLMRSYTEESHPRHVEDIRRDGMEWGSSHPTAHLHAGGARGRGRAPPLPARELLVFHDPRERREIFMEPIAQHILGGLSDERQRS